MFISIGSKETVIELFSAHGYSKNFAKLVIPSRPNSFARIEIASQKGIKFFRDSIETDFSFKLVKRVKFV